MQIHLFITPNTTSAQIWAKADDGEALWVSENGAIRSVKIWHNGYSSSMHASQGDLRSCNNDFHVSYESNVPFSRFCQIFFDSDYNDPKKYSILTHNCANAAHFALKISGVDLPVGFIKLIHTVPSDFHVPIPGPVLTPLSLYYKAKTHRIQLFCSSSKNIDREIQQSIEVLRNHIIIDCNDEKTRCAKIILTEVEKQIKKYPHQKKDYHELLMDTNDMFMNEDCSEDKAQAFHLLAERYHERLPSKAVMARQQFDNFFILYFVTTLTKYTIEHFALSKQFAISFFKQAMFASSIEGFEENWQLNVLSIVLMVVLFNNLMSSVEEEGLHPASQYSSQETTLSRAMRDLASECCPHPNELTAIQRY